MNDSNAYFPQIFLNTEASGPYIYGENNNIFFKFTTSNSVSKNLSIRNIYDAIQLTDKMLNVYLKGTSCTIGTSYNENYGGYYNVITWKDITEYISTATLKYPPIILACYDTQDYNIDCRAILGYDSHNIYVRSSVQNRIINIVLMYLYA